MQNELREAAAQLVNAATGSGEEGLVLVPAERIYALTGALERTSGENSAGGYHCPTVDVRVQTVQDLEGERDEIRGVEVDGVKWPVTGIEWSAEKDPRGRGLAVITLKVRGKLRIHETEPTSATEPTTCT